MEQEMKPFDKVLVRDDENDAWEASFYSRFVHSEMGYNHICMDSGYKYCIPYEGNEHLLGTTDSPKPKRWRADMECSYYYFDSRTLVDIDYEGHSKMDEERYKIGNYFKTAEEAEAVAEKVRKLFKGE